MIGPFLALVRLLGRRTAELHGALADEADPVFARTAHSFVQRSMYQAMRGLTGRVFRTLRHEAASLPEPLQQGPSCSSASRICSPASTVGSAATRRDRHPLPWRLPPGQVLVTGADVAIDFE